MNRVYYILKDQDGSFLKDINECRNSKDPKSILKTTLLDSALLFHELKGIESFRNNNDLLSSFKIQRVTVETTITPLE